jgi:NitT/TauT family transport system permease protein
MTNGTHTARLHRGAIASVALLVVFLAAWQWGPGLLGIPSFIVPPLSSVAAEFVRAWQIYHLPLHTGVTVAEVLAGFILGSLLGALAAGSAFRKSFIHLSHNTRRLPPAKVGPKPLILNI